MELNHLAIYFPEHIKYKLLSSKIYENIEISRFEPWPMTDDLMENFLRSVLK